jgi:hypothetical protein
LIFDRCQDAGLDILSLLKYINLMDHRRDIKKNIFFHYRFIFNDGVIKDFHVNLDPQTLDLIETERDVFPRWTELTCHQCPHCTLERQKYKHCPIAVNLIDLVYTFKDIQSYEAVEVIIDTEARRYSKQTALQQGLSSLIGIYMVTSGCPIMEKLKPMVRYHLPFATLDETRYRVLSMYCLAQYFIHKHGRAPDWELRGLIKIYDEIRILNQAFCKRLSCIKIEDASVNAVVILNNFADYVSLSIDKQTLDEVAASFRGYFENNGSV